MFVEAMQVHDGYSKVGVQSRGPYTLRVGLKSMGLIWNLLGAS
jgi:hypothetical protein